MTGVLTLGSDVGLIGESPYCARGVIDDASSESPRIKYWQGWVVSTDPLKVRVTVWLTWSKDYTPFFMLGILRNPAAKMTDGILDTIGGR